MSLPTSPDDAFPRALRDLNVQGMRAWLDEGHVWPMSPMGAPPWTWAVENISLCLAQPAESLARRFQGLPPRLADSELLNRWNGQLDLLISTGQDAGLVYVDRSGRSQGGCLHELAFKASIKPIEGLLSFAQALLEKVPACALEVVDHRGWTAFELIENLQNERSSNHNLKAMKQAFGARMAKHRLEAAATRVPTSNRAPRVRP